MAEESAAGAGDGGADSDRAAHSEFHGLREIAKAAERAGGSGGERGERSAPGERGVPRQQARAFERRWDYSELRNREGKTDENFAQGTGWNPARISGGTNQGEEGETRAASKAYKYEDMPVKTNGENHSRAVFDGKNHSGIPVELHMTELAPGMAPHPPHHHVNEEALMLRSRATGRDHQGTDDAGDGGIRGVRQLGRRAWLEESRSGARASIS